MKKLINKILAVSLAVTLLACLAAEAQANPLLFAFGTRAATRGAFAAETRGAGFAGGRLGSALGAASTARGATSSGIFLRTPIKWQATRPKGTQQTYEIFRRTDINWSLVRTQGPLKGRGLSNAEASKRFGFAPQLKDGHFATLHHLGQKGNGRLVEASTRYHGAGKSGQQILHGQFGTNKPHPVFPVDRRKFKVDTRQYWMWRSPNK